MKTRKSEEERLNHQSEKWLMKEGNRCSIQGCLDDGWEQFSFQCYAGRWCDSHWPLSGYRDATDPSAKFDPAYAGERIEPLD